MILQKVFFPQFQNIYEDIQFSDPGNKLRRHDRRTKMGHQCFSLASGTKLKAWYLHQNMVLLSEACYLPPSIDLEEHLCKSWQTEICSFVFSQEMLNSGRRLGSK